jgi:signal transduction histidine kinase
VVRHAHARACDVRIEPAGAVLRVTVSDDGTGPADGPGSGGHGRQTMRERAEELRGSLRVRQAAGTTVVAELPMPTGSAARPTVPAPR